MSKSKLLPTLSAIRSKLRDAAFNPRKPGPMQVILDSQTPDYLLRRAIESLKTVIANPQTPEDNDNTLRVTIGIIAAARAITEV